MNKEALRKRFLEHDSKSSRLQAVLLDLGVLPTYLNQSAIDAVAQIFEDKSPNVLSSYDSFHEELCVLRVEDIKHNIRDITRLYTITRKFGTENTARENFFEVWTDMDRNPDDVSHTLVLPTHDRGISFRQLASIFGFIVLPRSEDEYRKDNIDLPEDEKDSSDEDSDDEDSDEESFVYMPITPVLPESVFVDEAKSFPKELVLKEKPQEVIIEPEVQKEEVKSFTKEKENVISIDMHQQLMINEKQHHEKALNEERQTLQQMLKKEKEVQEQLLGDERQKIKDSEEKNTDLLKKIADLQQELEQSNSKVHKLQGTTVDIQHELEKSKSQHDELKNLEQEKMTSAVNTAAVEYKKLLKTVDDLKEENEALLRGKDVIEGKYKQQIEQLEDDSKQQKDEITSKEEEIRIKGAEIERMEAESAERLMLEENRKRDLQSMVRGYVQDIENFKLQVTVLKQEGDVMKKDLDVQKDMLNHLREQKKEQEIKFKAIIEELQDKNRDLKAVVEKGLHYKEKIDQLEYKVEDLEENLSDKKKKLSAATRESTALRYENEQMFVACQKSDLENTQLLENLEVMTHELGLFRWIVNKQGRMTSRTAEEYKTWLALDVDTEVPCLSPVKDISSVLRSRADIRSIRGCTWNVDDLPDSFLVSKDLLSLESTDKMTDFTIVGTLTATEKAITFWEVLIEPVGIDLTYIGVSKSNASQLSSRSHSGWALRSDGYLVHMDRLVPEEYCASFIRETTRIGVLLDLIKGEIVFFKDGKPLGLAFKNVSGKLYPAVTIHGKTIITADFAAPIL
jgi:hypothetical protein